MPGTFHLSVVAPDRSVAEETVTSVVIPGTMGYFGVWNGRSPFVSAIKPGILWFQTASGEQQHVAVGGGFAEVLPDKTTILANHANRATDIDVQHAREMLESARRALRGEDSSLTREQAAEQLEIAIQSLKAAGHKDF
ncbi:MAG: ATP synthase F1 subunit epsilon [Fimbriimonadaceae bacterium]